MHWEDQKRNSLQASNLIIRGWDGSNQIKVSNLHTSDHIRLMHYVVDQILVDYVDFTATSHHCMNNVNSEWFTQLLNFAVISTHLWYICASLVLSTEQDTLTSMRLIINTFQLHIIVWIKGKQIGGISGNKQAFHLQIATLTAIDQLMSINSCFIAIMNL